LAGSHRAERPDQRHSSLSPWAVVVAVVLALVPAVWLGAQRVFSEPVSSPTQSRTTDLPIPPVSPSAGVPATSPSRQPSSVPSEQPAANLTRIAPDAPRRIVSTGLIDAGFDNAVTALEPATSTEVARWGPRGSPGSPGTDTVYVVGKVFTDGGSAFASLPRLKTGAEVSLRTDTGTLTYTVRATTLAARAGLAGDGLFTTRAPGRLVLIGVRYDGSGSALDKALVVTAELTGAERA
jgi:hypothetical protein